MEREKEGSMEPHGRVKGKRARSSKDEREEEIFEIGRRGFWPNK